MAVISVLKTVNMQNISVEQFNYKKSNTNKDTAITI